MENMHVTMKDINLVKGIEPDTDNGGRMVDGIIVGPKISVNRWQIKDEGKLFTSRSDAEHEIKRRNLHAQIFCALDLHVRGHSQPMTAREVVQLIRQHGKSLKNVLIDQKYKALLGE
jgi:hypothetical protein